MKTTRIFLSMVAAAIISCGTLSAQNAQTRTERRNMNPEELMEKRIQRLESQMSLDDATAAKFAPVYKEYMKELKACHPSRSECKRRGEMTDADRTQCIEKRFDCRERMLDVQKKYYKKFKGFLNARQLECLFDKSSVAAHRHGKCDQNRHKHHAQHCTTNGHHQHAHQTHCAR